MTTVGASATAALFQSAQKHSLQPWSLETDIDAVLLAPNIDWSSLRQGSLLITGGTGFIGRWLLEVLVAANRRFNLNLTLHVLSRRASEFVRRLPHLAHDPALLLIEGDVRTMTVRGPFTHIVHAAADASASLNENDPLAVFRTIVKGTENVLEIARAEQACRTLFLSSGAVYGQQPAALSHVAEEALLGPDPQNPRNTYAEAKRAAETLCALYRKQFGTEVVTARIFSLLGPFLPLDIHFAAGNFIRDALSGRAIQISGNGRPVRSYLYPGDLVHWLMVLLTQPSRQSAYNIGSEQGLTIAELAQRIAELVGNGRIDIADRSEGGWNVGRYVPDTRRIREEFSLEESVDLDQSILRTAQSYGWQAPA